MSLETATYISDLVASNPAASDGLNNADDHMRLIKGTLKNTLPNVTGAVAATHTALDAAATAATNGATLLADAGAHFKTNNKDGIENPVAGKVSIVAQDAAGTPVKQTVVEFTGVDKKAAFKGPVDAVGAYSGGTGQLVPIGTALMSFDNTLPAEGGFCWANGGTLSRSANPILWARWGTRFGAGDGSTTFNVPNLCEVVPVGNSTMGGVGARGIITQFTSTLLTTIGGWFGESKHQLTTAEMPSHTHANSLNDPGHAHGTLQVFHSDISGNGGGGLVNTNPTGGSTASATTGITINNASAGSDQAHNIVQPSGVVNWIIRIG